MHADRPEFSQMIHFIAQGLAHPEIHSKRCAGDLGHVGHLEVSQVRQTSGEDACEDHLELSQMIHFNPHCPLHPEI